MFCFLRVFFFFQFNYSVSLINRQTAECNLCARHLICSGLRHQGAFFFCVYILFFFFHDVQSLRSTATNIIILSQRGLEASLCCLLFFFFIITLVFYDGSHRIQKTKWQYARFCPLTCGYIRFGSPHLLHSCIECTREWWWRRDGGHEWQYCSHRRWQPQS